MLSNGPWPPAVGDHLAIKYRFDQIKIGEFVGFCAGLPTNENLEVRIFKKFALDVPNNMSLWQDCDDNKYITPIRKPLMSFYCSANTILNVLNKPSQHVLLKLLYCNCVPILTYACEVKRHNGREMTNLDVALNDCIRKIFGFHRWESTRELRKSFGYESVTEIFTKRSKSFMNGLNRTGNSILIRLKSLA